MERVRAKNSIVLWEEISNDNGVGLDVGSQTCTLKDSSLNILYLNLLHEIFQKNNTTNFSDLLKKIVEFLLLRRKN